MTALKCKKHNTSKNTCALISTNQLKKRNLTKKENGPAFQECKSAVLL